MKTFNQTFDGQNLKIFCDEALPNFEPEKLFKICDEIQEEFFEAFNIKNKKLKTPVKLYLFRTRDKWFEFDKNNKNKLSSYCLDRQTDYLCISEDVVKEIISKFLMQNFGIQENSLISKGIEYAYADSIYFKDNYEYLHKHWALKTLFNKTFQQDKDFAKRIEAEFVVNYLLENGKIKEILNEKFIEENLEKAKNFYSKKYNLKNIPSSFDKIENVEQLLCFLDREICAGYKSSDGQICINKFKDIHEKSISQSTEDVLKSHVATCADYATVINNFLQKKGFETKIFYAANYETPLKKSNNYKDLINSHYRVFYKNKNGWTQVEASSRAFQGEHTYKTLSEGLAKGFANYFFWKNFELYEVETIKPHSSFVELYDIAKNSKKIKVSGNTIKDFEVHYEEKPFKEEKSFENN